MAEYTKNYNLEKQQGNEYISIERLNDNFDKIDAVLGNTAKFEKAGGTATTITLTGIELTDGNSKTFIVSVDNGGKATIINNKPLYKPGTTSAPNLKAGKAVTVWYDASGDCFFIKASAEGDAVADHVLAGKTFSNDEDTGIVGAMPAKNAATYIPGTADQIIPAGQYLSGDQVIKGDEELKPENIRKGATIFGVTGTSKEATLNIFVGEQEPETKHGIWIRTNEEMTGIAMDKEIWLANDWSDPNIIKYADPPYITPYTRRPACALYNGEIYLLLFAPSNDMGTYNYKYNPITNIWTQLANPTQNHGYHTNWGAVAACVGDKIYVFGGNIYTGIQTVRDAFCYDISTNTWESISDMPVSLQNQAAVTIGTDIYLIGGSYYNNSNTYSVGYVYKYDTLTDTYKTLASYPISADGIAAVAIDGVIYAFGGRNVTDVSSGISGYYVTWKNECYKYDISNNKWSQFADLSDILGYVQGSNGTVKAGIGFHTAVAVGNDIYITGGMVGRSSTDTTNSSTVTKYHFKYNIENCTWSRMSDLPQEIAYHVAQFTNNAIHVLGGTHSANMRYNFNSKQYPEGTVVILRLNNRLGKYVAELITPAVRPIGDTNIFLNWFEDVLMYLDGTLQDNLPTYYGDGTKWVQFKGFEN